MITELREELKKEIENRNLQKCVEIAKKIGISLRQLCRLADVNVGNVSAYINGNLVSFTEIQEEKLFNVLKQLT